MVECLCYGSSKVYGLHIERVITDAIGLCNAVSDEIGF